MGVTLRAKKQGCAQDCDMGYHTFNILREDISDLFNAEFAEHYRKLSTVEYMSCFDTDKRTQLYAEWDAKVEEIIRKHKLSTKIVDFLLQPDCDGKIGYGTCKLIYNLIKNCDNDKKYGYIGHSDCTTMGDIKKLLKSCYENKSSLIWF